MTSLTAIIGAVPLMLSMGRGTRAGWPWGPWSSSACRLATLVTLLVVPAIYHLIARRAGDDGARDRLVDEVLATATPASPSPVPGAVAPRA